MDCALLSYLPDISISRRSLRLFCNNTVDERYNTEYTVDTDRDRMTDLTDFTDIREPNEEPPDFTEWEDPEESLKDQPIRERMLDVILQLRDPTKVAEIAERAGCDTETARSYLEWFASMGMVHEHVGRPTRYERNGSYLRWRRVERIRNEYSEAEIVQELETTLEEREEYQEQFETDHPDDVSFLNIMDSNETDLTDAWEAISEWKTVEKRAELLDMARRSDSVTSCSVGYA